MITEGEGDSKDSILINFSNSKKLTTNQWCMTTWRVYHSNNETWEHGTDRTLKKRSSTCIYVCIVTLIKQYEFGKFNFLTSKY